MATLRDPPPHFKSQLPTQSAPRHPCLALSAAPVCGCQPTRMACSNFPRLEDKDLEGREFGLLFTVPSPLSNACKRPWQTRAEWVDGRKGSRPCMGLPLLSHHSTCSSAKKSPSPVQSSLEMGEKGLSTRQ